jgi:hypothetical protein
MGGWAVDTGGSRDAGRCDMNRKSPQIAAKCCKCFTTCFPQCLTKHGKWGNIWGNIGKKWGNISPLRDKKRDVRNYKQKKENDKNITGI